MNFLKQPKWWMRVLIGAAWIPVGGELFLRFLAPVPMLPRYIEAGPHGVRANMPNQTYRHQTPEYTVEIRTNSQGMRADQEFAIPKPPGTRRIAVLGDSFSMGYGVNMEDTSLQILEENLETELECDVEILNFSVSGFGPAEELIVLEEAAMQYEPDLIIQYFTSNDPIDDTRANLFVLEEGELQRSNDSYLPAVKVREFLFSFSLYRWMAGESHLYNLIRDMAGSKAKQVLAMFRSRDNKTSNEPPIAIDPEGPTAQEALSLAILSRMMEVARVGDAEFLILSIPVRRSRAEFKETFPDWSGEYPVVSPIAAFEEKNGEMLYWEESHGHWTPLGCRLVASELTDRILDRGLLGESCP
ncbi:MAG: SGNH/GDSL hydrolase family protein [Phycisphaera sp. TMED9]|nr:MAG: SGNH/GDSL hydrolase family protein [Phycisphaera sp. TMED9]